MDRISKTRILRLAIRLVIVFTLMPAITAFCQCRPTITEKTTWGVNMNVVLQEAKPMRNVEGVVADRSDKPLGGVLVEVYDHPEILLRNPTPDRVGQKRIAACITNEKGSFSIEVPPGHYELRFSRTSEWNVTSIPIRVTKSASSRKKGLMVQLSPGQ